MINPIEIIPEINEEEIKWICDLMQLDTFDEPRRLFIKSRNSLDISACPGSGKTTLVVAKLAILANKWKSKTRGICVLSHTNAAREEIQSRLGNTIVGQQLLSYPHFIDTIHGFTNRFLAIPWLISHNFPSPTIDDELTARYRKNVLTRDEFYTLNGYLSRKHKDIHSLRIINQAYEFNLKGKEFGTQATSKSYLAAKKAIVAAANAGYFCFDEMFVWANSLLSTHPSISTSLQCRFPLILIDEMQDTTRIQGNILHTVFPLTSPNIVIQRVGDTNQTIFNDDDDEAVETDPFPNSDPKQFLCLPNSFRFGQKIASIASAFAITPVGETGLIGNGPKTIIGIPEQIKPTIIIFHGSETNQVINEYGKFVLRTFADDILKNQIIKAVGAVHQDCPDIIPTHPHFPKSVTNYWNGYHAETARKDSHPTFLFQYFIMAQSLAKQYFDLSLGVEKIASGMFRLASLIGNINHLRFLARSHRSIIRIIEFNPQAKVRYEQLVKSLLVDHIEINEENWKLIKSNCLTIAQAMCNGVVTNTNATSFLSWENNTLSSNLPTYQSVLNVETNKYRVYEGTRFVDIQLGSIHSVKGQTHFSTLLLNTFWNAHSSQRIMPWLLGEKTNLSDAKAQDKQRLLQTYVAMTRPSHLLCLAIPRFVFPDEEIYSKQVGVLKAIGWEIIEIYHK